MSDGGDDEEIVEICDEETKPQDNSYGSIKSVKGSVGNISRSAAAGRFIYRLEPIKGSKSYDTNTDMHFSKLNNQRGGDGMINYIGQHSTHASPIWAGGGQNIW